MYRQTDGRTDGLASYTVLEWCALGVTRLRCWSERGGVAESRRVQLAELSTGADQQTLGVERREGHIST